MLLIAKVLKSNGTDGGLLIGARNVALEDIDTKEPVFINFDGLPVPFFILSMERKGTGKAIVHLNDIDTLEDAEEIVGADIFADIEVEDEMDGENFIGWEITNKGKVLGKVADVEPIPGNPCIYVTLERDGSTVLIPLHDDFINRIDSKKKILDLNVPEGLL